MKANLFLSICLLCCSTMQLKAQDPHKKIPADINFLGTFNSNNFFDLVDINDLNSFLVKSEVFEKWNESGKSTLHKVEDMGISLSGKSYIYTRLTDSVTFVGGLIPLADAKRFEAFLPDHKKIHTVDGLQTIYSADRTIRVSWDAQTIYVMTGHLNEGYLAREDVKERFGLTESPYHIYDDYDTVADAVVDTAYAVDDYSDYAEEENDIGDELVDSMMVLEVPEIAVADTLYEAIAPPMNYPDDYEAIDDEAVLDSIGNSIYAEENNADETADAYYKWVTDTDSIKASILSGLLVSEMSKVIQGTNMTFVAPKNFSKKNNSNTVAHFWVRSIDELYSYFLPNSIVRSTFGYQFGDINLNVKYGYEEANVFVDVEDNTLKIRSDVTLDKDASQVFKSMYTKKINPKMYKYLADDALGYLSVGLQTESYLKSIPSYMEKIYAGMFPRYSDAIGVGATLFDVILDEKAIGKVFKGDNLFVLNGVTKQDIAYTDYEYDDNYNYTEVQRTKTENIPQFLWMFSSEDMRIFEKLLAAGIKENQVTSEEGLYTIKTETKLFTNIYLLMKDGMVFIGNDQDQMKAINSNTYRVAANSASSKKIKKNALALLFKLNKLPATLADLGIPITPDTKSVTADLAKYGDFYMVSPGIKGNQFSSEIGIEFPKNSKNALQYLMEYSEKMLSK